MKTSLLIFLFCLQSFAWTGPYPQNPNFRVTPGSLCNDPSTRRYPERVAYCDRDVETHLKEEIIQTYDRQFGYQIGRMQRAQFKIDHLIPLCAGGSNKRDNLWPQHVTIYNITDPLEPAICNKMAQGKLRQADAVKLVLAAKADLHKVAPTLAWLNRL